MSTRAPLAKFTRQTFMRPGFNIQMAYACVAILIFSVLGCLFTSTHVPGAGLLLLAVAFALVILLPLLLYLTEKGMVYLRDSILVILLALFFSSILGYPVTVAARLDLHIGLQDAHFVAWDRLLGINVSAISAWASASRLGILINKTYYLLFPYMKLAVLLPVLTGRLKYTQKFITANLVAFAIGLPVFALFPAIGPWYGLHLAARPDQADCQAIVLLIRHAGPYLYQFPGGVICFPSFHVVWAILCAYALWGLRPLRIPASLFSAIIIVSTLTIGNHYLCDVLAGLLLAVLTVSLTERLARLSLAGEPAIPAQTAAGPS